MHQNKPDSGLNLNGMEIPSPFIYVIQTTII